LMEPIFWDQETVCESAFKSISMLLMWVDILGLDDWWMVSVDSWVVCNSWKGELSSGDE
jgi:hypothetical protein